MTTQPSQFAVYLFLVILALLILLFVTIWALGWFRRRYLLDKEEKTEQEPAYDITQLRQMYDDGVITGEEFERLKRKIHGRRPYPS